MQLTSDTATMSHNRWTPGRAMAWHAAQPWIIGNNFIPSYAANQLEMWQKETFDPIQIDTELGWAASLGMNAVRVYLHDLLWEQDEEGFVSRIDAFLALASRHGIRTMFVLFDSCWDPNPTIGAQKAPQPGVHNSAWVQSPGMAVLRDTKQHARLERYIRGVVAAFGKDPRVLLWDIWNEPDNGPNVSEHTPESLKQKADLVLPLMEMAFGWARASAPMQPLTSAIWTGDWSSTEGLTEIQRAQTENSDVISFHNYGTGTEFQQRVGWLRRYGRPLLCTEYLARATGSTFEAILPFAKREGVGAFNWGLVMGKTQTHLPWTSWSEPRVDETLDLWFHDIFHPDGRPYREHEAHFIRALTLGLDIHGPAVTHIEHHPHRIEMPVYEMAEALTAAS
jgi:hypothetical protein